MPVNITFLGHAGFLLESGEQRVAIDPFLTGNPVATIKAEDVRCNFIVLTHGHADHIGDTVAIAKANDATVAAAFEICDYLAAQGVEKCEPGNPGGKIATDFGWIAFTQAFHSSSFEGRYMGQPCGVVVSTRSADGSCAKCKQSVPREAEFCQNCGERPGVTIYHCGDTALFSDMKLIGEIYKPDVAMIPVGDRFTMGPELGARAAEFIKPKVAIPIHYGTWPVLTSDISAFKPAGVEVKAMKPGESWTFGS